MHTTATRDRPLYLLVVRPVGGGAPDRRRLARAMKAMLRGYGLRVVSVEPYTPTQRSDTSASVGA